VLTEDSAAAAAPATGAMRDDTPHAGAP